ITMYNNLNESDMDDECPSTNNRCPVCREDIFEIQSDVKFFNKNLLIYDYRMKIKNF
ncbi:unnamed protein product, partial [marine sediment metagenome]